MEAVGWNHSELLHSSHSTLCSFVLQVGLRLLFCFFLQCTLLCKQTWNSCDTSLSGDTVFVFLPRPRCGGEICKRHLNFENASIVFPSTSATPVIFVFEENPGDTIIFEKLGFRNVFRSHKNAKPAFSNSSGFEERF